MATEETRAARLYVRDLEILEALKEKHADFTTADCIRVCVEYSRAHGVIA